MQPNQTINELKIKYTWTAILNQSGTNPPTAIVLHNTFGETFTFEYETTGSYFIKSEGKFTANKTIVNFGMSTDLHTGAVTQQSGFRTDDDTVNIVTYLINATGPTITRQNDRIIDTPITITTYY